MYGSGGEASSVSVSSDSWRHSEYWVGVESRVRGAGDEMICDVDRRECGQFIYGSGRKEEEIGRTLLIGIALLSADEKKVGWLVRRLVRPQSRHHKHNRTTGFSVESPSTRSLSPVLRARLSNRPALASETPGARRRCRPVQGASACLHNLPEPVLRISILTIVLIPLVRLLRHPFDLCGVM